MPAGPSVAGSVNEMSVRPVAAAETFCTIMSMLIPASAITRKILAASPTTSGTPATVIFASLRSCATPEMIACSTSGSSFGSRAVLVTQVPSRLLNEDRTWIGMPYRRAYSTQRSCSTLEPQAASSSISRRIRPNTLSMASS